jgi:hypothetical protein
MSSAVSSHAVTSAAAEESLDTLLERTATGPSRASAPQRENFLYLIRCGIVESVPSRRILSVS